MIAALKTQKRDIENLKNAKIASYSGFGIDRIVVFGQGTITYPDGTSDVQTKLDEGHYTSIEDFDSYHTADIEFNDLYEGTDISTYRQQTKVNLIDLGKSWRERIKDEFPNAEVTIIVHQENDDWFLDTFNYPVKIENGIYL
jgi:hypothetical protein